MSVSKICAICGDDCANKPRLKDAKGHYACRACYDAKIAKQAKPKPTPKPPSVPGPIIALDDPTDAAGDDLWNDFDTPSDDAIASPAGACPACGTMLPGGQAVCTSCGFNTATGHVARTKVGKAPKSNTSNAVSLGAIGPVQVLLVLVGLAAALVIGTVMIPDAAIVFYVLSGLWSLIATIMMIAVAFQDDDTKWGVIGICSFIPCLGAIPGLIFVFYYCIFGSQRPACKANFWIAILGAVGVLIAIASTQPQLFDELR